MLTDLPPYAWNHNTEYLHEGRLAQNYRHRPNPPHKLLGTLSDDSSDLDMRWTKYVRQSELEWLKDHIVKSECIFPGAGYLLMAIEAVNQRASIIGLQVQGYTLRDVTFSKVLVVPDTTDGVEISLSLEPFRQSSAVASATWNEFRVISFGPNRKSYEHCHGLITVTYSPNFVFSSNDEAMLAKMRHNEAMTPKLYEHWLSQRALVGNETGPSLQMISKSCLRDGQVFCTMQVPDASDHGNPPIIGVPLMDSILQVVCLGLAGRVPSLDGALIVTSIAELVISPTGSWDSGHVLHCRGSIAELGPRDLDGQVIVAQDGDNILEPVIQLKGVKFVFLPQDENSNKSDDTMTKL